MLLKATGPGFTGRKVPASVSGRHWPGRDGPREGKRRGGRGGGEQSREKPSSGSGPFSAYSWAYRRTPATNRCASRFATTASALRASAVRRGNARSREKARFLPCEPLSWQYTGSFAHRFLSRHLLLRQSHWQPPRVCSCLARRHGPTLQPTGLRTSILNTGHP